MPCQSKHSQFPCVPFAHIEEHVVKFALPLQKNDLLGPQYSFVEHVNPGTSSAGLHFPFGGEGDGEGPGLLPRHGHAVRLSLMCEEFFVYQYVDCAFWMIFHRSSRIPEASVIAIKLPL